MYKYIIFIGLWTVKKLNFKMEENCKKSNKDKIMDNALCLQDVF